MNLSELLFVYGTLKESSVQKEVIGRTLEGIVDVLEGYKKSKTKINNKTYPIIAPDPNSSVKGLVISITPEELELIDEYETKVYKRKKVVLQSGKMVWVYQK